MYDAGRVSGVGGELFILSIVTVGWLIILNLFIAVILVRMRVLVRVRVRVRVRGLGLVLGG